MASTSVIVKNRFLDKENGNTPVEAGQPLKVSAERAKSLVEIGYAEYTNKTEDKGATKATK